MAELSARPERLRAWLDEVSRTPLVWGRSDCLTGLVAGWIARETGIDPAAPWRGRYWSEIGAAMLVHRAGGLVALMDKAAARCGLARTEAAQVGDVGAIQVFADGRLQLAGAICSTNGWAFLMPCGLHIAPAPVAAAWRI